MAKRKNPSTKLAVDPSSPDELAKLYGQVQEHPLGGLLVEDLAASREHGVITGRVGIAPDGNPIIYARDRVVAEQIGKAVQHSTAVHVRPIPAMDVEQFKMLASQSMAALPPPGATPVEPPRTRKGNPVNPPHGEPGHRCVAGELVESRPAPKRKRR